MNSELHLKLKISVNLERTIFTGTFSLTRIIENKSEDKWYDFHFENPFTQRAKCVIIKLGKKEPFVHFKPGIESNREFQLKNLSLAEGILLSVFEQSIIQFTNQLGSWRTEEKMVPLSYLSAGKLTQIVSVHEFSSTFCCATSPRELEELFSE